MEEVKEEDGGLNRGAEHELSTSAASGEGLQLVLSCACYYKSG